MSLSRFGESYADFAHYKLDCLTNWVGSSEKRMAILDFGCGLGGLAKLTARAFPRSMVTGYDISPQAIDIAEKEREGIANLTYTCEIPRNRRFHLIIAANVFHHIPPQNLAGTIRHLKSLLAPGGNLVIFEHNPLNPITRYIVRTCPLDADARLIPCWKLVRLARGCGLKVNLRRYMVFFPKVMSFLRRFEARLGCVPFGAQYMLSLGVEEK